MPARTRTASIIINKLDPSSPPLTPLSAQTKNQTQTKTKGLILRFPYFLKNDPALLYALFFLFQLAMSSFAYALGVFCRRAQTAVYLGFIVFLVGWVFQSVQVSIECVLVVALWCCVVLGVLLCECSGYGACVCVFLLLGCQSMQGRRVLPAQKG